jgi:hypothetical protein
MQVADAARAKVQQAPPSFWVECLIEREGDTVLNLGNIQYTFRRNEAGKAVCEIINQGHYTQILKSDFYTAYVPVEPVEEIVTPQPEPFYFTDDEIRIIDRMLVQGEKHTAIAAKVSAECGREISRQRITRYHQA